MMFFADLQGEIGCWRGRWVYQVISPRMTDGEVVSSESWAVGNILRIGQLESEPRAII